MPRQRRKRETKRQGKKRSQTTQAEVPQWDQWEVEYIKLARINKYGEWEYLIAWHGFTADDDTWEPKSSLGVDCSRLLDSFHEEIERQEDDPPPFGTLLEPSDEWIRQEIAYFHRTYGHQEQPVLPENDSEDGEFVLEESNDEVSEPPVREEPSVRTKPKSRTRRNANPPLLPGRTRAQPIERDSESEDEVIEIITPKKRRRASSREDDEYHKSGRKDIEDEDEDDDDIPLTQLGALRAAKKRTRAASFNEPQTKSLDFTSLSINDSSSNSLPHLSPNVTHKSNKPKPPPLVIPSSLPNAVVDPDSPLDSTTASGSTTGAGSLAPPFKSPPKRKKSDKGKGKEKETTTQLPTPFSVSSTANPMNSTLTTKRRLAALALNPQTPQEIVEESKRKRYASLKFQKLDPAMVATGVNEMREEEELFPDAREQRYDEDQGMDIDMPDMSLPGPERERGFREHSSERWRSPVPSPMRSPVLVSSSSPSAPSAKEPPGLYESQPQLFQQHSPPPTPILQRTMTSFNAAPSPFQSPVMIPKDAFAQGSRNDPIENRNDEFDAFDSFILDDYSEGNDFSGFIHYEPESLAGCPLLDHDENPLGDQLSIPDINPANNFDQQVEERAEKPIITQVNDSTKGVPATPTTRRIIPKPNFFFSPRNRPLKPHKPWEWNGTVRLFTQKASPSSSQDKSGFEVLCDTVLTTTTSAVEDGMSFAAAISSMKTLDLKMLGLQRLNSILAACKKVPQVAAAREVAELGSEVSGKEGPLKKLASYMISRKMIAIVEFHLEHHSSGIILLIPRNVHLLRRLGITSPVPQCACIAALYPWSLPPILPSGKPADVMDWEKREPSQDLLTHMAHTNTHFEFSNPISKRQMGFEERLRFLRLPAWLYDDLNGGRKGYHILNIGDSSSSKEASTECMFLQSVLRHPRLSSQTKHIRHLDENTVKAVRIVFIHAASLQSLHKMPFLVDLKRKKDRQSLDVAFYMFGTSSTVDSRRWCFEEVYILGGVVTFTPLALFENPEVVCRIVQRVSEHPIWVGYVIPSVVGLAVKLWYQRLGLDPLQEFERGTFIFNSLLTLIDDGKLSLIHAPPEPPNEDRYNWMLDQTESVLRDPKDTLEYCLQEFDRRYGDLTQNEWVQAVEMELSTDFQRMHIQPIVMNNWRRMVVLTSGVDRYCDGLEWVNCNDFRFDDASDDIRV